MTTNRVAISDASSKEQAGSVGVLKLEIAFSSFICLDGSVESAIIFLLIQVFLLPIYYLKSEGSCGKTRVERVSVVLACPRFDALFLI